jgi:O-antigen ligase
MNISLMIFNTNREKLIFYNFPVLLFTLIPFFLITGPFLSDLSISLISILFLIYCYKKKNFSYFKNKYFYFFLFFWGYLILNTLINNFNLGSLKISFFYFRFGVFVIAITALLNVDHKFIKYFFYCICICFIALILDGFYQYFVGTNVLGWSASHSHRVASFFHRELILGSYLSRLWPIFFGLSILIFKKKNKLFFLLILIFILSEALIFLSGDRSAFFYINLSAIFIILFSRKLVKLRLYTLLTSILLLIVISFIDPTAKNRVFDQTLCQMNLICDEKKDEKIIIFSRAHHEHYVAAYKMFLDNKILGVGVKNFRNFCSDEKYYTNKYSCATHPHNSYIQILSETGIIGFSFLLFVFLYFCKYVFKHFFLKFKKKYYFNDFEICILSGLALYLWPIVPTGNVFSNWLNILLILNLPFLIWSRKKNK